MKKATFQASTSSGNARLNAALKLNKDLVNELADADVFADIATELYRLRKNAGIRQKDLAKELQVQQSNISRYESPGYSGYTIKMLLKYVRKLNGKLNVSISPPTSDYSVFVSIMPIQTQIGTGHFVKDDGTVTTKKIRYTTELKHTLSITNANEGATQYGQFKSLQ